MKKSKGALFVKRKPDIGRYSNTSEASAESGDGSSSQNPGEILINLHSGQLFQKESAARYFFSPDGIWSC